MDVREPSDGQWGAQMENGSWSGVVEMTNSSNTFVDLYFVFGILFLPTCYMSLACLTTYGTRWEL